MVSHGFAIGSDLMVADVDWSNLQVASAFVLGAVLGVLAAIRIMRAILQTFERDRRRDRRDNDHHL